MIRWTRILVLLLTVAAVTSAWAQDEPAARVKMDWAPRGVTAADHPGDDGGQIDITWEFSPGDSGVGGPIEKYLVLRATSKDGLYRVIADAGPQTRTIKDETKAINRDTGLYLEEELYYKIRAVDTDGNEYDSDPVGPVKATSQIFATKQIWFLVITIIICASVIYFIESARRGKKLFIRKIAGLEAVDEAIGRATEMGRPILFVAGIQDMNDIQTVAGITILGRVAKGVAEYGAQITVPTSRSLVMTAARETVKASYLAAGRPDAYNDDMVYYLTDEQFGYVAAVTGIMVREKPAACFYQGAFFAESLILAETGNTFGAIQIAGTAMPAQLPFFVAACDYTLIGEEFFAASAYLSGEPQQLGSLKGQDVGKGMGLALALVGGFLMTLASIMGHGLISFGTTAAATQASFLGASIVEIGDEGDLVDEWTLQGAEIGENTGPAGELYAEIVKDDPVEGGFRISLYSDEVRKTKVSEGKGSVGTLVPLGPVGGSGMTGSFWLRKAGEDPDLQLRVPPGAHGMRKVAEAVHSVVEVEG